MAVVIPSINNTSFAEATVNIRLAVSFLSPQNGMIHLDVSDGEFTNYKSWGDPDEFKLLEVPFRVGVHLMVRDPEKIARDWLKIGVERVIAHVQAVRKPKKLLKLCRKHDADLVLAADPTQSIDELLENGEGVESYLILSVTPGPSGQKPDTNTEEKIRTLRERMPTATIMVDGGVTADNAAAFVSAGANELVSGNYIFGSPDPAKAYETLSKSLQKHASS